MTSLAQLVGLAPLTLAGAAAMTFGAAYVRGLTGFGMAIILVPLLGLIITPGEAVVLGILLQLLIGPVGLKVILADADRSALISATQSLTDCRLFLRMETTSNAVPPPLPTLWRFVEAPSLYGHDAFLKEDAFVGDILRSAFKDIKP